MDEETYRNHARTLLETMPDPDDPRLQEPMAQIKTYLEMIANGDDDTEEAEELRVKAIRDGIGALMQISGIQMVPVTLVTIDLPDSNRDE